MTYQRFVIDLWENPCDWLRGKRAFILDWTVGKALKYSNINHPCPYRDQIYVKADNISMVDFPVEQLFPAGRYRVDINITDGTKKKLLVKSQFFLSVSDHRVERFW